MDIKNCTQESYNPVEDDKSFNPVEDEILHPDEGEEEDKDGQTDNCT